MKKLLFAVLLLGIMLSGCITMHYGKPHGQDISVEHTNKIPANVGVYLPETFINDSVEVTIGDQFLDWPHITTRFQIKSGSAFAQAIQKSVAASFANTILLDSISYKNYNNDSISLFIKPLFIYRSPQLWRSGDTLSCTFESKVFLDIKDNKGKIIDSVIVTAIGVASRKVDSSKVIDSVMDNAADSAIKSFQDQIVEKLNKNNSIRRSLSLPILIDSLSTISPRHGLYGSGTIFSLDTISESLVAIPPIRRWSLWDDFGVRTSDVNFIGTVSIGADLLIQSHLSFRLQFSLLNYFSEPQFPYYSFPDMKFIYPERKNYIDWGFAARTSYLFFGPRNFLEVGLGVNIELGKYFNGIIRIPNQRRFQPMGIIGFRHQSIWYGEGLGISYTPYYDAKGIEHQVTLSFGFGL